MSQVEIKEGTCFGTFSIDGQSWDVENNLWVVGNDDECIIIDAPHDVDAIANLVGDRKVLSIVCTHGHDDHIRMAPKAAERFGAPVLLHQDDLPIWKLTHPNESPSGWLEHGQEIAVGDIVLKVIHTPGHSPGSVCLYSADLGTVFSGDTLFAGGPGATGRSYSDFPTIIDSISTRLLTLVGSTVVRPGHGQSTTIEKEAPHLQQWIQRGH